MARERMSIEVNWHEPPSPSELAAQLSEFVAQRLKAAIADRGQAFIAVSGGTTPKLFFQALSQADLDWTRVVVTLVDERFAPPDSPRSNLRLVNENLLQGPAAAAKVVPLYRPVGSIEEAAQISAGELEQIRWPLDVAVLGMGTDGHTASFFPDSEELADVLDAHGADIIKVVNAPSAQEPRLTLTLPRLVNAGVLVLHIEGQTKRAVIDAALAGETDPPIRAVLSSSVRTPEIFWAP